MATDIEVGIYVLVGMIIVLFLSKFIGDPLRA